jgi:hypothetical protein
MATKSIETAPRKSPPDVHHILVVANETVGARELIEEIARRTKGRKAEVKIVAPALVKSPVKYALADVDEARKEAQARLEQSIEAIMRLGVPVSGGVGDADPNLAIEDALRTFPADEVIISTHPPERSRWLEDKVVERAHRDLTVPVTHVVVDLEAQSELDKVRLIEWIQPRSRRRSTSDEHPDYLPPMRTRDRATLVIGIVGTIVLGISALLCADNGSFSGGCIVRFAIASAAFMITLWHSVALLVMGSLRYRGYWNDIAADIVLFGIPPAILVSLLVG